MKKLLNFKFILPLAGAIILSACGGGKKEVSNTTGWNFNDPKWGGMEKLDYEGQATGPNLVLIEGGTVTMGITDMDVMYEWNNVPRRVTVPSFYMDETEISNHNWRDYLYWLERVYGETYPEHVRKAFPDTLVWREELSYNEPLVENYFRYPSFDDYPVVGISWLQANEYCKWRSDRVNEMVLVKRGVLNINVEQKDAENFNTEAYLVGQYTGEVRKNLKDLRTGGERPVRYEDGILLPAYRLPTEAEWEYAAWGLVGNMASEEDERITDRRIYPWNGNTIRYQKRNKFQGDIMANIKKGYGDYMGMAGNLNDHAAPLAPVRSFYPNDYGLFNMAGNVSEWVMDVYRPMTSLTLRDAENQDFAPFRGNDFQTRELNEDGLPVEKDSLGHLRYRKVTDDEVATRENYQRGNVLNYLDGDKESEAVYETGKSTLISDKSRVYKGGSWSDRAWWTSPGARRFKDEDKADRTIGFRCAMTRVGPAGGNNDQGGNIFATKSKRVKRTYD